MIVSGGENIYPEEVEDALIRSKLVAGCAVVGMPDDRLGARVVAFVEPAVAELGAEQLDEVCLRSGLARFKRPKEYVFVKAIPRSASGKLLRRKLRAGEFEQLKAANAITDNRRKNAMSKDYAEQRASVLKDLDGLHYEVDAKRKVGTLWLDRPPLNVVSYRGRSQINAIMEAFGQDPDVRVVVIRGKNGVYTSGGDVKAFPDIELDGMSDLAWNIAAPRALPEAGDLRDGEICYGRRPRTGDGLRHSHRDQGNSACIAGSDARANSRQWR